VPDRLLIDLAADGRASVIPWREGELPAGAAGEPQPVTWPVDGDALEELRWYLEDYLRAPYGVYESRGPQTAARLGTWGEAVFGAVFGQGAPRDAYKEARASQPAGHPEAGTDLARGHRATVAQCRQDLCQRLSPAGRRAIGGGNQ